MPSSPQPRRRARTAGENATAATQPAVHRAHSTPAPRSAGRLIQVITTASEEDAAGAPKLGFLPRVSIRLGLRAGSADASVSGDAARRSVSLVVKRRPRPGKVVTTTVSVDYRVVLFVALVALIASAAGLSVPGGGVDSEPTSRTVTVGGGNSAGVDDWQDAWEEEEEEEEASRSLSADRRHGGFSRGGGCDGASSDRHTMNRRGFSFSRGGGLWGPSRSRSSWSSTSSSYSRSRSSSSSRSRSYSSSSPSSSSQYRSSWSSSSSAKPKQVDPRAQATLRGASPSEELIKEPTVTKSTTTKSTGMGYKDKVKADCAQTGTCKIGPGLDEADHRIEAQTLNAEMHVLAEAGHQPTKKELEQLNAVINSRPNLKPIPKSTNAQYGAQNLWLQACKPGHTMNCGKSPEAKHGPLLQKQLEGVADVFSCKGKKADDTCLEKGTYAYQVITGVQNKLVRQSIELCKGSPTLPLCANPSVKAAMPTRRTQTVSEMLASKMSFSGPSYEQQELGAIDLTPLAAPVVTASVFIVLFVAVPVVFWRAARRRRAAPSLV